MEEATPREVEGQPHGLLHRVGGFVRRRPVTTLAVGAAIGAMAGAELLAAGLVGGATVLLLERGAGRTRELLRSARDQLDNLQPPG